MEWTTKRFLGRGTTTEEITCKSMNNRISDPARILAYRLRNNNRSVIKTRPRF